MLKELLFIYIGVWWECNVPSKLSWNTMYSDRGETDCEKNVTNFGILDNGNNLLKHVKQRICNISMNTVCRNINKNKFDSLRRCLGTYTYDCNIRCCLLRIKKIHGLYFVWASTFADSQHKHTRVCCHDLGVWRQHLLTYTVGKLFKIYFLHVIEKGNFLVNSISFSTGGRQLCFVSLNGWLI